MSAAPEIFTQRRSRSGVAMILVLCVLALMSVLFVTYFSMIMTERLNARNFAVNEETRQLAGSVLNVVMAQIFDATTESNATAWTSQPGMIRTFDADGNPSRSYKLYSSDKMVVAGGFNARHEAAQEIPADWKGREGEFVDLNAPSRRASPLRYPIVTPDATKQVTGFQPDSRDGVAMPVRWIYVLQDGRFAMGKTTAKGKVKVDVATPENPIVGRVAFWTDDETCKVNINTASEGVFWDMPRTQSSEDRTMAMNQPVTGEYQRMPGHPATVCLSTVFPDLVGKTTPRATAIYDLIPRVAQGGSQEGTVDVVTKTTSAGADTDRIYASVDELLYNPSFTTQRASNGLTSEQIERGRFFLTVNSRSPELNLFGLPRVTIWPIHVDPVKQSATDRLIAFCSTLPGANKTKLYFSRQDARSSTADYANDSNNQTLYNYLRKLTSKPFPGFGGISFESKYGNTLERDQILTEIYDTIRSLNLMDPLTTAYTANTNTDRAGLGQVMPIEITTSAGATRGFGRMATITEAALDFYAMEADPKTGAVTKIGVALLLSTSTPAHGYFSNNRDYVHEVTTVTPFKVTATSSTPITFSFSGTNTIPPTSTLSKYPSNDSPFGGDEGFGHTLISSYPFVMKNIPVTGNSFGFDGGKIEVAITSRGQPVQTLTIEFPAASDLPVPRMPPKTVTYSSWSNFSSRASLSTNSGFFQFDTVRSVSVASGDARLIAAKKIVSATDFAPGDSAEYTGSATFSFGLRDGSGRYYDGARGGKLVESAAYPVDTTPKIPAGLSVAVRADGQPGDWDNGMGCWPDGAYISKPDEGCARLDSAGNIPYFNIYQQGLSANLFFIQHQAASPVLFGSLPTGVIRGRPWETLLFCPNPSGSNHLGAQNPPDYLWLDLFTIPTVEPYAISEPLTANGRVNMNYEMVPFTGIMRTTALRAALKSTKIMAIPTSDGTIYKRGNGAATSYRYAIDPDETLKQFDARFADGNVFKSAAEICSLFLVPAGAPGNPSAGSIAGWWQGYQLTGDNTREMPYSHLYPLLTTQSNSYKVHYRTQSLTKLPGSDPTIWEEGKDVISGEYRGASQIERWLDPNEALLKNVDVFSQSLTRYYKFRVINTATFMP